MTERATELRRRHEELKSGRRMRSWAKQLVTDASQRVRAPDDQFDAADAFEGDLWWLLIPVQMDPDGLTLVWADPAGRCVACEDRRRLRGAWIEHREDATLVVVREEDTWIGEWEPGATEALFAVDFGWWAQATLELEHGRIVRVQWRQSSDGQTWDEPWSMRTVCYDDDGTVLAVHGATKVDEGGSTHETLFERAVELPEDAELTRRAHDDLAAACWAAIEAGGGARLAGARLWYLHDEDGARNVYANFDLCDTLAELLGEPPDEYPQLIDLPTIAPWSRRTFVHALEERLLARGDNERIDAFVTAVVRELNERLELAHGDDGPVLLPCVGWVDEDTARPALTAAQWARWQAEDWTSQIAQISGDDDGWG